MPDRTEDMQEIEALDRRVDELLTDVEETAARIDAALPDAPGTDDFETADSVLGEMAHAAAKPAAESVAFDEGPGIEPDTSMRSAAKELEESVAFASADETLGDAAAELEAGNRKAAADAAYDAQTAADFSSPDAIAKLDEKLAASAKELSDSAAADVVDDRALEQQVAAAETVAPPMPAAPVAAAATPQPAARAPAAAPVAAPVVPESRPAAKTVAAPAAESTPRRGPGMLLADALRPLAVYTSKMKPGTRQTIAYAAVVTLFQAACLWAFLAFKGPPGEPAPTSDPVILRQPGDAPAAKDSHAAPKKAAAKPKASAKADDHGGGGH